MQKTDKKNIIIAGGAKSLGKYLALKLYNDNYNIIVLDNDEKSLELLKKESPDIKQIKVNLIDEQSVLSAFAIIEKEFGSIYALVYNAGYANSNKITDFTYDEFMKCINVNLVGYFLLARETAKNMIKNNIQGSIIEINSKSGCVGSMFNAGYSAAKFGGVGLTQSLALDLAKHNIRVNALMLGNLLNSQMFESLIPAYAKKLNIAENKVKDYYIAKVPLKRGCEFEDVYNVLSFYISEKASYCTGQSIKITGGQVM
ncbi:sorbitol-6-phosphate dehydrogenase [Spiroplasma endosymbiont of Aspidapion aeneum]|uniref:sorbitol-6-phosphate dehydrogenase n=1 Tax=Spiroplasma endosymbiont of Aspidapion aeneum TaxID=3066276 RepID=UPI00313EFFD8